MGWSSQSSPTHTTRLLWTSKKDLSLLTILSSFHFKHHHEKTTKARWILSLETLKLLGKTLCKEFARAKWHTTTTREKGTKAKSIVTILKKKHVKNKKIYILTQLHFIHSHARTVGNNKRLFFIGAILSHSSLT